MKKTLIIILIIVAVVCGVSYAYIKLDMHIPFIDNYAQNFSDNLFNLKLKLEMKKLERKEELLKQSENAQSPEGEVISEEINEENVSEQTPPQEKIEENKPEEKKENVAQPGKNDIKEHKEVKISKTQKKDEEGNLIEVLTRKLVQTCHPIPVSYAASARYARFDTGIVFVSENQMSLYDKKGEVRWNSATNISDPVLKTNGDYALLWETDGQNAVVYKNRKQIYSIQSENKIITGYISAVGECVLVTQKPYYKGEVIVFNKSGEIIYSRSFGSENIMAAAISDTRRLAVALMSVDTEANSKVAFFDINKTDEDCNIIYKDTIIYDMEFNSNSLIAYADGKMMSIRPNAKEDWVYNYGEKILNRYMRGSRDTRMLMFDNQNNAELSVISLNGRETHKISTEVIADFGDIYNGYIIYNSERNLYLAQLDGTLLAKYVASRDIKKAYFIDDDNILVVYNTSFEFLHIERNN